MYDLARSLSVTAPEGEMFKRTNLENKGLISADRNNKATLLLTIPRFVFKSSAKDLSPPISYIEFRWLLQSCFHAAGSQPVMMLGRSLFVIN